MSKVVEFPKPYRTVEHSGMTLIEDHDAARLLGVPVEELQHLLMVITPVLYFEERAVLALRDRRLKEKKDGA